MNRIVVDSDIASYVFKALPFERRYSALLARAYCYLSFMSVGEMRAGALMAGWGHRRRAQLDDFIQRFDIRHSDDALCSIWGSVRADGRAQGREISAQDAWIASTAIALDAPLATNNRRDYEHIAGLELLQL